MKTNTGNFERAYTTGESGISLVEETVSPLYARGGLGHAIGLLGISEPDSLLDAHTDFDLVSLIRKGFNKGALDAMMAHMDITATDMARIMHTSDRTMRRYTKDTVLNPEQSERLLELARLFAHGLDAFGSRDRLRRWMNGPVQSLGGQKPIDLLDTSVGIGLVNDVIGRIEYGIVS